MPDNTKPEANASLSYAQKQLKQRQELKQTKAIALTLLVIATVLFLTSIVLPELVGQHIALDFLKTVSEAAMIGALADWFAVRALFKPVPIPIVRRHTNIIPNNKQRIADNLADFVQEKFFHEDALKKLVREHDPVGHITDWIKHPENSQQLSAYALHVLRNLINMSEESVIQQWLTEASHEALEHIDIEKYLGTVLAALTENGKHQALLNAMIDKSATYLTTEESQTIISRSINEWLKSEYPTAERMLPANWISKNGAQIVSRTVINTIENMHQNPEHFLRKKFDDIITQFIHDLQHTDRYHALVEQLKHYVQHDDTLNSYLKTLWQDLSKWLQHDIAVERIAQQQSQIHERLMRVIQWVAESINNNVELRARLNQQIERAMTPLAPDISSFITTHMSNTLINWPDEDLVEQIELNIGKDLHYIRINGTVVGAMIGAVLFGVAQVPKLL